MQKITSLSGHLIPLKTKIGLLCYLCVGLILADDLPDSMGGGNRLSGWHPSPRRGVSACDGNVQCGLHQIPSVPSLLRFRVSAGLAALAKSALIRVLQILRLRHFRAKIQWPSRFQLRSVSRKICISLAIFVRLFCALVPDTVQSQAHDF